MGMRGLTITALMSAVLASLTVPACAGAVSIVEVERDVFEIDYADSTVDDVLNTMGERFGFAVERVSPESPRRLISGRFIGNADQIVTRILRGHGHVVIRAIDVHFGIQRILLVGASVPNIIPPAQLCPQGQGNPDPTNPVTPGKPSPTGSFANCGVTR